jgi:hypothetical protein
MSTIRVISIVPRLHPSTDGVGDYALCLARQLRKDYEIETQFIVGDPDWDGPCIVENFNVSRLETRSPTSLASTIEALQEEISSTIIVHLSGYGYAKWSIYDWLINGLKEWRSKEDKSHIITFFHETYSYSLRPWKHNFWLAPAQKRLAQNFIELSNLCITNCQIHSDELIRISKRIVDIEPIVLPIPSTIGESRINIPLSQRSKQMVVFGQKYSRIRAYTQSTLLMSNSCHLHQLEKVIDIGSPTGLPLSNMLGLPVIELGRLSSDSISQLLSDSVIGWMDYNPLYLGKSSIFAAYCAHGVVPVVNSDNVMATQDKLQSGINYLLVNSKHTSILEKQKQQDFQSLANQAMHWYSNHSLVQHASYFAGVIRK